MKRAKLVIILGLAVLGIVRNTDAAGSEYGLSGFATAGANPTATLVITDAQGNGVRGVVVNITCTAGLLDLVSGTTGADGTLVVRQSGGSLGDNILATCASVSQGSPYTLTSANAQTVAGADTVISWFDESRRLFNAVVVQAGIGVMTSNSNFNFYVDDNTSDYKNLTLGLRSNLSQTAVGPARVEVYQGTFSTGDRIYVDETTVSGANNGENWFSSNQPNYYLLAYAVEGASPTVCAVVADTNGVGIPGVTVTASSTSGSFMPAILLTDDNGEAYFRQLAGSLGDTLTVQCLNLTETSPVMLITENSRTLSSSDKIFSWYARKTRNISTVVVNRDTNVLVGSASAFTYSAVNINSNNLSPALGDFLDQTARQPARSFLAYGTSESGDLMRIRQGTVYRYPNGGDNYHSILGAPPNESRYLLAFATGGADPTIWAVVTEQNGNAVQNVQVDFALQGSGSLDQATTTTAWSGIALSRLSGGSLGNTITVSAANLGQAKIYTSNSTAVAATDKVCGWFDPETHKVFGAVVNAANNVMTSAGTALGQSVLDNTPGNNTISISSYSNQTPEMPCRAHISFGSDEAGDYIRFNQTTTAASYDAVVIVAPDPAKFLLAFARGNVDPKVWAVVMDDKGNGLGGEAVTFTPAIGSMSLTNTVTGYGGYVISDHTSGLLGNTITVSAPGLPPVQVITSAPIVGKGDDWGLAWYDADRLTIWGIITTHETNVVTSGSSYSNPTVYDMTSNNRTCSVNGPMGHDMNRVTYPLNQWPIAFGTADVGDEVAVNMGWTSNNPDAFIRLGKIRARYLQAYASSGANPSVRAIVVDANGAGVEGVPVYFNVSQGSMSGGPTWYTNYMGVADSSQSGGLLNDVITVFSPGYPEVEIYTYNSGGVAAASPTLIWYAPSTRRLNVITLQYPCYHITVNNVTPGTTFQSVDQTDNNRTVSITAPKEDSWQLPTYGYVGQGTSGAGDQIKVQTAVTYATDDALITLPADLPRYLWAFAQGGSTPDVWAVVTDAGGNGIPGVPITFSAPGGSMSLPTAITEADGSTVSSRSGGGTAIYISADGMANTITVTTSASGTIQPSTRALIWYDLINRLARTAFVNVPNNVLAVSTNYVPMAMDRTDNGRTFAIGSPLQQTSLLPAGVSVTAGTEGEGDQIWNTEVSTAADPDSILTLSVPESEIIIQPFTAAPATVSIGQDITVTMTVFNNGSPSALSVTPSTLNVVHLPSGDATYHTGPSPASWSVIPGGERRDFTWTYAAANAGYVAFYGSAYGTDSYSFSGITATAQTGNPVLVQIPAALSGNLQGPDNAQRLQIFSLTLTVTNSGQAAAVSVTPSDLILTGASTTTATTVTAFAPASVDIPGGESRDFVITCRAGETGVLQYRGWAQGYDANSNSPVAAAVNSNLIQVIQGALNLDRITSPHTEVYQGQKGLTVVMEARNTSLMSVTLTASALRFNDSQTGFSIQTAPENPLVVAPQTSFTLRFTVDVNQDAPLGTMVINGTLSGDSVAGGMTAVGAQGTATWQVLKPFNSLRQNYPNPLRLSQRAYTTFEYFIQEDIETSLKLYNLAGELVAVLVEGKPGVGHHRVDWYGDNGEPGKRGQTVGSAVYLAVYQSGGYKEIKKVVVIR